jgi:hypothetical protein
VGWVELSKDLLEFYDISWYKGTGVLGNLVHAPNVAGIHTTRAAKKLYKELFKVHKRNIKVGNTWQQGRDEIAEQLQDAGKRMAELTFLKATS